jgi:Ca2+-binding RTX toxin-like protein
VHYYGGDGNDTLGGNVDANQIYGGQGNDIVLGGTFIETGIDPIIVDTAGPSGDDNIEGGAGRDWGEGFDGNDTIYGQTRPFGEIGSMSGLSEAQYSCRHRIPIQHRMASEPNSTQIRIRRRVWMWYRSGAMSRSQGLGGI